MTRPPVLSELPFHRRQAKKLAKENGLKLSEAQNRIAILLGFEAWSLMVKWCNSAQAPKSVTNYEAWQLQDLHRSYLHGDQYELDSTLFFCMRCNDFVKSSHFNGLGFHKDGRDVDIYISAMEAQVRSVQVSREYFRPLYAGNILAARAAARQWPDEKAPCAEFYCWLQQQVGREDSTGEFSRFAMRDANFPRVATTFKEVADYLGGEKNWFYSQASHAWNERASAEAYLRQRHLFRFDSAILKKQTA